MKLGMCCVVVTTQEEQYTQRLYSIIHIDGNISQLCNHAI